MSMSYKLMIYGAGGHARVIADMTSLLSEVTLQCFVMIAFNLI